MAGPNITHLSDEALMRRVCAGHVAAFDEIHARYSRRLFVYLVRLLAFDRATAEDLLQDIFLKIAEDPTRFDAHRSFKTWLFSVASNACKNVYRHRQVRQQHAASEPPADNSPADFAAMSARLDAKVFRRVLENVLCELPPEKREAFLLRYEEDLSLAEIAELQECPVGSVKSRLHYTIRHLAERLKAFDPIQT